LSASVSFCAALLAVNCFLPPAHRERKAERQKAESNRHMGTKNKTLHPTHEDKKKLKRPTLPTRTKAILHNVLL